MSKYHKRNKPKRRRRNRIKGDTVAEIKNSIGEIMLSSTSLDEDVEILQTPFGEIKISDGTLAFAFKNKGVLLEVLTMNEEIDEEDTLSRLVFFEKLNDKYPDEPYIAYEIAECYRELDKIEKAKALTISNYKKYKGFPLIDASYMMMKHDLDKEDVVDEIFGESLNIHEIYPAYTAFDTAMVAELYFVSGMIRVGRGELSTAKDCAEVVGQVDKRRGLLLRSRVDFIENPWLKWKTRFIGLLLLLAIIGIVVGVIWGVISFFRMIF